MYRPLLRQIESVDDEYKKGFVNEIPKIYDVKEKIPT